MFRFGILQRYVIGQLLRAFALALLTITAIFVLIMVMTEATKQGLAPGDIVKVTPFIIPGTLPYSVPVALLFAVSVVYGRLAGDNEVVAVKTAGLSAMNLIWPTLWIGLALGLALTWAGAEAIPRANHHFKALLFADLEDMFYKKLKKDREMDNPGWPFFIRVNDVQDRILINATFKRRVPGRPNEFSMIVNAKRAHIKFDSVAKQADITLEDAETLGSEAREFLVMIDGKQHLTYPIPDRSIVQMDKKIQEKTNTELEAEEADVRRKVASERQRQAAGAALNMAFGRFTRHVSPGIGTREGVDWAGMREAYSQYKYWKMKDHELKTERHLRVAMAFGALFFVLLGAPVGVLFARRDFLSAFISCFIPIILVYYPTMLLGINLGKQGTTGPWIVWVSNLFLGVLAGAFAIPPVMKH